MLRPGGVCALLWLMAAGPPPQGAPGPAIHVGPVALAPQPGSKLDAIARQVAVADVGEGGPGALVMLGSQSLGTAAPGPALFVQVQSDQACGSAGCSVSVYLPTKTGWTKVLDAVGAIAVQASAHGGMHDLVVGKGDRFVWNGRAYADTLATPQVDLRPRHRTTKIPSPAHP